MFKKPIRMYSNRGVSRRRANDTGAVSRLRSAETPLIAQEHNEGPLIGYCQRPRTFGWWRYSGLLVNYPP